MYSGRLKFNAQEWRKENEIPDEMTDECLEALWEIMATFVELAHEGKSSNNLFPGLYEELSKKDEKAP